MAIPVVNIEHIESVARAALIAAAVNRYLIRSQGNAQAPFDWHFELFTACFRNVMGLLEADNPMREHIQEFLDTEGRDALGKVISG